MDDVEGNGPELFLRDHDCGVRTKRMTYAQLIEGVRVGRGQIGHHHIRFEEPIEHRLFYCAAVHDLVGANAVQSGGLRRLA